MVLMCYDEVESLFHQFHDPRDTFICANPICNTCDPTVYSTCTLLCQASDTKVGTEYLLSEAARRWKPFTDAVCDTSKCLSCPDYSWCHRLREIYDKGVLCYDSSDKG